MNTQINSLLRQTEKIIEKHDAIDKAIGGKFNIFSILGMEHYEVKTHSAFIYDFINPQGSHVQGDTYLRLFAKEALEIEVFNCKDLKVKREDPTNENRRIDFTIENDQYVIAIEMKIYASDQHQQLVDYASHINSRAEKLGKKAKVYYLTLDGNDAEEISTRNQLTQEDVVYKKISFSSHILKWIEMCTKESVVLPAVRETLAQYSKLLRKITNQNEETMDNELVELLLKDSNLIVADKLSKALPEVKAKIELKFWKKVNELLVPMLSEYDLIYRDTEDDGIFERIRNRQKSGVGIIWMYHKAEYAKGKLFNFALAYDNYNDKLYIGCYPCKLDGTFIQDSSTCVKLLNEPFKANKHYEYFGQKRNFFGDGIFELLDPNKCDEMAEETVNDLMPYLEILQQRINNYFQNKQES